MSNSTICQQCPTVLVRIMPGSGGRLPIRHSDQAAGMDICATRLVKKYGSNVYLYGTGLQFQPSPGYHIELVPRSSISKTGYILANSIGVIDNDYRGELLVALRKIDSDAAEIREGDRICQILLRRTEPYNLIQVDELNSTARGSGGFGSTNGSNNTEIFQKECELVCSAK